MKSNRLKSNESGFTAFEIVIVIVALLAIGVAGYFAYQARHSDTDHTVTVPVVQKKAAAGISNGPKIDYVNIENWGVKVPMLQSGNTISYQIDSSDPNQADFVSSEQKAVGGACGTFAFARYHVLRASNGSTSTNDMVQSQLNHAAAKITIGTETYYVLGDMSGGDCSGRLQPGQSMSQQEATANADLLADLKGLVAD